MHNTHNLVRWQLGPPDLVRSGKCTAQSVTRIIHRQILYDSVVLKEETGDKRGCRFYGDF